MATREGVVVLIAHADRCIQSFGQGHAGRNRPPQHHPGPVQDHRKFRPRQKLGRLCDGRLAARRPFERHRYRQIDVDDLSPVVTRHVDLRRGRMAPRVLDHPVQHLGHARGIAHLFLIGDHVLEQGHLFHFLKPAHADRLVGGLRRHQQQRCVVPVGRLDRCHEIGDPRPVLRNHHAHLAGRPRVAIGHHPAAALMRAIPELDPGFRKQVRDRHEGRPDDTECVFDPMHLQDFDKSFFGGHAHGNCSG